MNIIDAAHTVLAGQMPNRLDEGGKAGPIATAYYCDVPKNAIHPECKLTQTEFGYAIEGSVEDCRFHGQAFTGADSSTFRRVLISFVKHQQAEVLH